MTRDRLVAALKPTALDEVPMDDTDDMDVRISAIIATPRPDAARERRVPRKRLLLAATGAVTVTVTAAAAAIVAVAAGGHDDAPARIGPAKVQAAALSFTRRSGHLIVTVKDPVADPARYKKEFAAHGLNIDLRLMPSSPKNVGSVLFLEDDGDGQVKTITAKGRCGTDTCSVGIKVPLTYKAFVRVVFGRPARPGEQYETGPGDTPGEGVGLSNVKGRTVADVLAEARRRHIGTISYRYEDGPNTPRQNVLTADQVKSYWYVHDAVAGGDGLVIMFVGPRPTNH
ncbi:hypothetical protein GCM10027176_86330 [Actinoallomurus bryophytorum]|uniref:Uncharacterized protein n=1 Tax=Actinoallomurus bryophytorum TaxID=1490222 RepID=A0A543CSM3_9ACTN|nr:hypothetical protein [Actinoallomurus bryophytorum]TQM00117.1 hypothetical protein FB559_5823 [Actinoallomurus bryophytorum]